MVLYICIRNWWGSKVAKGKTLNGFSDLSKAEPFTHFLNNFFRGREYLAVIRDHFWWGLVDHKGAGDRIHVRCSLMKIFFKTSWLNCIYYLQKQRVDRGEDICAK